MSIIPVSAIYVADNNKLKVELSTIEFLATRCRPAADLQKIVSLYWDDIDGPKYGIRYFLAKFMNQLPDFLNQNVDLPMASLILDEFGRQGSLPGAGPDDRACLYTSESDPHNLLDQHITHLVFGIGERWYVIAKTERASGDVPPYVAEVPSVKAMFQNGEAFVRPVSITTHYYHYYCSQWLETPSGVLPLDQYPVTYDASLRGKGRLYWDGSKPYDPISGFELKTKPAGGS